MTDLPVACHVALPIPSFHPYTYRLPPTLADRVAPGARVVVPVRRREMVGIVTSVDVDPRDDAKAVLLAPDDAPLLPPALLTLATRVARYYATPIGITLRAMLPGALWGESRVVARLEDARRAPGGTSREVLALLDHMGGTAPAAALARKLGRPVWDPLQRLERAGAVTLDTEPPSLGPRAGAERVMVLERALPSLAERERVFGRAKRQREAFDAIDALGGESSLAHLTGQLGFSTALLHGLMERGVARIEERARLRDPFSAIRPTTPEVPSPAQAEAIGALDAVPSGGTALLFGVTGSGKTLAYLEAIRAATRDGAGAIVLVPEIALTPQTIARVRGVFGDDVAVLHSALSDGERADAWRAAVEAQRRIVVGARSAVFAPVRRLAVIVIDEEHDASYKHGEAPRYHARHVAGLRGAIEGARVILASATPSLEVWGARERVRVVRLPRRVGERPLPPVRLLDLRHEPTVKGAGAVPWTEALDAAVTARLAVGEQVLLLLNRRGFARYLQCAACGEVVECPNCSIALTVHRAPPRLRCHYCGYDAPISDACPTCGGVTRRTRGVGTQLLEKWLSERFPEARLARMDADTTSTKWSHGRILAAVGRREVDVLFGTQMIAKGLDFPDVTLVGVIDADTGLHLPDFRAAERTFQLIAQVAGRAGRGPRGGEVLVQTRSPTHPALLAAAEHDYEAFAERELAARRAPAYPPHVALVNVTVSGTEEDAVSAAAVDVGDWLRGLVEVRGEGIEVVGPAPAPLARINRRWRWHLILRTPNRRLLGRIARYAGRRAPHTARGGRVRVVLDRDPVSLL